MIGYMIGLGDRHLDNVLVDLKSGQVRHSSDRTFLVLDVWFRLDYSHRLQYLFWERQEITRTGKGSLPVNPKPSNSTGRGGSRWCILSLLGECPRYSSSRQRDPVESPWIIHLWSIDWLDGPWHRGLAAFYGGQSGLYEQITSKKRQVEKDALLRMFHLRTMEMRQSWTQLG